MFNILDILNLEVLNNSFPINIISMLRMTSKKVKILIDKMRPNVDIYFNLEYCKNDSNHIINKKLDIIFNNINNIKKRSNIVKITMKNCKIGPSKIMRLKEILYSCNNNSAIIYINLCYNKIGPIGANRLSELIKCCPLLIYLNLKSNCIRDSGLDSIVKVLEQRKNNISYINLKKNIIGPECIERLSKVLKLCNNLIYFNIGINILGDIGIKSVAQVIGIKLKYLNLCNNQIGPIGMESLLKTLEQYTSLDLIYLNLKYNKIGDLGLKSLSQILLKCPLLEHLDINYNQIGDTGITGIISLTNVIPYCTKLSSIAIIKNKIGINGLIRLFEVQGDIIYS
jgi:Ran GTPase-activating protein (RanGAP) involved in mRNA processing and transport